MTNDAAGPVSHRPMAGRWREPPVDCVKAEYVARHSGRQLLVCAIPAQGVQRVSPYYVASTGGKLVPSDLQIIFGSFQDGILSAATQKKKNGCLIGIVFVASAQGHRQHQ